MTDLSDILLSALLVYGPPAMGLALMGAALGIPIPATMLLMAAGAFVQQGVLDGWTIGILSVAASVVGDSGSYALGRYGSVWLPSRLVQSQAWGKAADVFDRQGGVAILLTRFLLTPLALATNLIAGSNHYSYRRFLLFDVTGEIIWVLTFGSMGYLFADSWEVLSSLVSNVAGALVGLVALGGGGYMAWRLWLHRQSVARPAIIGELEDT